MCENCAIKNNPSGTDKDFQSVVACLREAQTILVLTHARPDGDGLGSMSAMAAAGRAAGKTVYMLVPDTARRSDSQSQSAVPPRYEFLFEDGMPAGTSEFEKLADKSDLVVVVDTCAFAQLDGLEQALRARREKVAVIDHHATAGDVGSIQWIDSSAAAAGVMVGEILEDLGWPVDAGAAEALFAAVASDTGWFRFSNTDPRALRAAAGWLERGAQVDMIYARIFQYDRPERLHLMERMLAGLELYCHEQLAVMTIRKSDFERTGARADETENLINEALRLKTVKVAVLLVEQSDCVRVSFRSRSGIDVAALAGRFGGGGHARASGMRTTDDLDAVKKQIVTACTEELERI